MNDNKEKPEWIDLDKKYSDIKYKLDTILEHLTIPKAKEINWKKRLFKWLFSIAILGSVPYQINTFLSSNHSAINYKISNFSTTGTQVDKNGKIHGKGNSEGGDKNHPTLNYTFSISGNFKLFSGQIKDAYIIYDEKDTKKLFSTTDFHPLSLKKSAMRPFLSYAGAFLPLFETIIPIAYHSSQFNTNEIHYQTTNLNLFYKPFYILTIDTQNHLNLQLLLIRSKEGIMSFPNGVNLISDPYSISTPPEYNIIEISEVLKSNSFENSYQIPKKEVQNSAKNIIQIAQNFYI